MGPMDSAEKYFYSQVTILYAGKQWKIAVRGQNFHRF